MRNASTCKPIPHHVTGGSASFKTPTSTVIPVSPSFGVLVYLPFVGRTTEFYKPVRFDFTSSVRQLHYVYYKSEYVLL